MARRPKKRKKKVNVKKFTHNELVEIGYQWLLKNTPCAVGFKELVTIEKEQPDVIGFGSANFSILLEAKTSRSDFFRGMKKPFRINPELGMGSQRFYICREDLIHKKDLPKKWGLIWVDDKGECRIVHKSNRGPRTKVFKEKNTLGEMSIMYSALRRLQAKKLVDKIYKKKKKK